MCKKLIFLFSFIFVLISASGLARAATEKWFEAEAADPLTAPYEVLADPCASGGKYINVTSGTPSSSASSPAPDGTASFVFDVDAGTYKVVIRLKVIENPANANDHDSLWVRIDSGAWTNFNAISHAGNVFHWVVVHDYDAGAPYPQVEFALDAGQHVLEIAYREVDCCLDAVLITDDLAVNTATLPAQIPATGCVEENILVNGGFEDGYTGAWGFDNDSPARETHEIVGDAQEGSNALKISVFNHGSSGYQPAFRYDNLTFESGKKYTWSVWLKGSTDGMQVSLKPEQTGGSYTAYGQIYTNITTEWVEYSTTTPVMTSTVSPADLSIWIGYQNGDIYVDHARFYEGDYVAPCPPEGPAPAVVKATKPDPGNGTTDLTRFNMLSWKPGDYADSHNVYLGTDKQTVTDASLADPMGVLVSQQQLDAFYDAVGDYGATYYWRIDEVNEADMTIYKGDVWNFSTKAIGLIIPASSITATASGQKDADQDPNKTIDGSGLNASNQHGTDKTTMWLSNTTTDPNKAWIRYDFDQVYKMPRMLLWNYNLSGASAGYAMKGITIEYSSDGGQNWTVLPDPNEIPKGTGTDTYGPIIVDLGGVADGLAINAFRIIANSNWSPNGAFKQYGLSEVKFYYIPVRPTNPSPADKATGIPVVNTKLTWTAGEGAVEHKVYFGTDEQAVTDGTAASSVVADTSFTPPPMTLGTLYYWRVVEVNNASVPSDWSGPTWSFTTSAYTVVDDFEEGSSLKWSGGSSYSGNGATVSLDTAIANNGSKSMKFMYDDTSTQGYSEASANPSQLNSGSNWTIGGPTCLVFWIYGDIANLDTEKLYVKLNDAMYWYRKDLAPIAEVLTPWWTQVTVPLVPNEVTLNNVSSLKIGFTRTKSQTGTGQIRVDDIRLYAVAPTPLLPVNPGDANLVAWYKMQNNANDSAPAPKINGTAAGDPNYVDGPFPGYGKAMEFYGDDDVVDLGPADPFNFTGSFSISFWVNIQAAANSKIIATRGETDGFSVNIRVFGATMSWLRFTTLGITSGGSRGEHLYVSPLPTVGKWTHVVCTYNTDDPNNATRTVYYDGQQVAQDAVTGALIPSTSNASIGGGANADNTGFDSLFKGNLDDVRFYNKVLTEGEIRFLVDPTP